MAAKAHGSKPHPLALTKIKKEPPEPDAKEYGWLERGGTSSSETGSDGEGPRQKCSPLRNSEESVACAWCQKPGSAGEFSLRTPGGGKVFCSEQCFTQCRRASFKRNKTCDWCRHVRHTVSYVDFQDGHHQLQFCSDKCLNQYKMNIFCKETEAHLEAHPHLRESGSTSEAVHGLITPELWLRDCRSPESEGSLSPQPLSRLETKKELPEEEILRKEVKKKMKNKPRRPPSPPRVPLHPPFPPPPPLLQPPWRRKPEMPGLVPLARPLPLLLPPPTTLVPYPLFLPIPIPIPIPIPLPGIKLSDLQPTPDIPPSTPSQPATRKRKRLSEEGDPLRKPKSVHA